MTRVSYPILEKTIHFHSPRIKSGKVATLPPELLDRRVEITGPIERKMVINALNSGESLHVLL